MVRTYYFDIRDGIPIRDRKGLEFPNASGAIEHSKSLARQMHDDPRASGRAFSIVVIDQSGAEIHRELVEPRSSDGG
jgi:Domain of unknown function (DUF6894)